ncbi:SIMPL domain-containing protein [Jatrophihabitans endophyticus]|uniref:SIMPL domain-containing protein n=1 Tax=Jatrophihabitans endophyticus TaxID=1206085 RepID=UPI0019F70F67|nr:SIMPL domain-containing protein [Jatrophihabitans endophyticus]MBE7190595.1 SIMPL domain-containing protein [Jatrophihabitans endophyticus]
MTAPTTISVRGEASRTVAPDHAAFDCAVSATPAGRDEVVSALRAGQDAVVEGLRDLGGVVLSVDSERSDLTWSFGGPQVEDEYGRNRKTGDHGPTGRFTGRSDARILVRRLDLLDRVVAALVAVERLELERLDWLVDPDNPAWREVRSDAIAAALAKADDYASALGGVVRSVDHIADSGLLAGRGDNEMRVHTQSAAVAVSGVFRRGGSRGLPVVEPVPQTIRAVVEARVRAELPDRPAN